VVKRVTVDADNPEPEPRNCSNAGVKSNDDSPCRYSSGSTSATFGDFRDHAIKVFDENRCCSTDSAGSTRLSFTRGAVHVTAPHRSPRPAPDESHCERQTGNRAHPQCQMNRGITAHVIALDGYSYRTKAHRPGPPPAGVGVAARDETMEVSGS